jgi:hypothetical protein
MLSGVLSLLLSENEVKEALACLEFLGIGLRWFIEADWWLEAKDESGS